MADTLMVWGNNEFEQISDAPKPPTTAAKIRAIASGGSINGLAVDEAGMPTL